MRIAKKGEYALRAMIVLALSYGEGPIKIRDISRRERIPQKFLESILLRLKKAGLLQSARGPNGGYSLKKEPKKITFAEVLRIINGPLAPLSCVSKLAHTPCSEKQHCGLYSVMSEVRDSVARILENVTFEDVRNKTDGNFKLT